MPTLPLGQEYFVDPSRQFGTGAPQDGTGAPAFVGRRSDQEIQSLLDMYQPTQTGESFSYDNPDTFARATQPAAGDPLGGWFSYGDLARRGLLPGRGLEGIQFGSDRPSTDNWRLLPPGYNNPNYMMRNGQIIDKYFAQWPGLYLAYRGTDALPQAGDRAFPMSSAGIGTGTRGYFWPGQIGPWNYQSGTDAGIA